MKRFLLKLTNYKERNGLVRWLLAALKSTSNCRTLSKNVSRVLGGEQGKCTLLSRGSSLQRANLCEGLVYLLMFLNHRLSRSSKGLPEDVEEWSTCLFVLHKSPASLLRKYIGPQEKERSAALADLQKLGSTYAKVKRLEVQPFLEVRTSTLSYTPIPGRRH